MKKKSSVLVSSGFIVTSECYVKLSAPLYRIGTNKYSDVAIKSTARSIHDIEQIFFGPIGYVFIPFLLDSVWDLTPIFAFIRVITKMISIAELLRNQVNI